MTPDISRLVDSALMKMIKSMDESKIVNITANEIKKILEATDFDGFSPLQEVLISLERSMRKTGHESLSKADLTKLLQINKDIK